MNEQVIENEIRARAKEWIDEYGEDFLVELIGDYLEDGLSRLARLRQAFESGDAATLTLEAHTLKSSSATLGAETLSALAKRLEDLGRNGAVAALEGDLVCFESQFALVKSALEKLRDAPGAFLTQER